jgi:hypothetical protein
LPGAAGFRFLIDSKCKSCKQQQTRNGNDSLQIDLVLYTHSSLGLIPAQF